MSVVTPWLRAVRAGSVPAGGAEVAPIDAATRMRHPSRRRTVVPALAIADLAAIAARLAAEMSPRSLPPATGEGRRYARLLDTTGYDAWLIAWPPSSALELHDHGGSVGAIHLVIGELVETYTDLDRRHPLRSRSVVAGDGLAIPAGRVHEVWNPGPAEALSVHVYSPRLTAMTFFDHRPEHFLVPRQRG